MSSVSGKIVWNLMTPFKGDSPILLPPNFVMFSRFFILAIPKNFMRLACLVKKFEFRHPRLKGIPFFGSPKLFQISSFFYIYFP